MMLGLSLCVCRQKLELVGGATESIFPRAEALLLGGDGYDEALRYVAVRKKMDRYRSVVDFLFCELHPEWRIHCRRFYVGNGPALREQITPEQILEYDDRLLLALNIAHSLHTDNVRMKDWLSFCRQVDEEIRLVA